MDAEYRVRALIRSARNRVFAIPEIARESGLSEELAAEGANALVVLGEAAITEAGHYRRATPADKVFAARLRQVRQAFSLSVVELSEKAGMSRTHLHNLESGVREPTLGTARRLCKALGVSLAAFD